MDMIERAKVTLTVEHVFWSCMLSELTLVPVTDIPTAATDGKSIFYNPEWFNKLSRDKAVGTLVHEISHPLSEHLFRRGNRNPKRWNIAADLSINPMIIEDGFKLPDGALFDKKYIGMRAEMIYEQREEERKQREQQGQPGDDHHDEQFGDGHSDLIETPMSDEEKAKLSDEIRQRVAKAAMLAEQAGQMTGGMARLVKEILYPPVSLAEALEQFYATAVPEGDEDWTRRDSRVEDYFEPTLNTERMGPVVVIGDTSGSVTDRDIQRCVGAIDILMQTVAPEQIIVLWWDTDLKRTEELETGDPIILHPEGGGGTRMDKALDYVGDNYEPEAVIMITDCETPWPKQEPDYPLIVLSTSKRTSPVGLTIPILDFA